MPLRQALKTHNLVPSAARTTSSNATALLPELVYDSNSLTFKLAITAQSGTTPTIDVYLQTTIDGGTNWLDCGHFTQVGAATATVFMTLPIAQGASSLPGAITDAGLGSGSVAGLPIMDRNFRVKWVIAGTTPSYTFSLDLLANNQNAGR